MSSPILHTFSQSGAVGQLIMVTLFGLSILAWGVIAKKIKEARDRKRFTEAFLSIFHRNSGDLLSLRDKLNNPCPLAEIYKAGANHLAQLLPASVGVQDQADPAQEGELLVAQRPRIQTAIDAKDLQLIEETLERKITDQLMKLDQYNVILSITATAGPLLGLLGTVWGIMGSFRSMGVAGNASISVVAPGISSALVTTVAGLIVAIPALVAFNLSINYAKSTTIQMENFAGEFLSIVKQKYLLR